MELCNKCLFYNPKHDELRNMWDDVSDDADMNGEKHYCSMYASYIPADIINGKKQCKYSVSKE